MSSGTLERVTVIVPCRNEKGHIQAFLDSIERQDITGLELECLIADGMSTDGTRDVLKAHTARHPYIRVIDNPAGIVSTGLNMAIRQASGDIIVRMDVHSEYQPDYIRSCVEVLKETGADNVGGAPRIQVKGFARELFGAAFHAAFAVGRARCHDPGYEGYVDTVYFGCWRRETFDRIGLFDEELVRNQDDELNLRIVRSGGKVYQSAKIVCWYTPRTSVRGLFRQYFQYGFWKVAVMMKHRIPASVRHVVPGLFVIANIVLALGTLASLVSSSPVLEWAPRLWGLVLSAYGVAAAGGALLEKRRQPWSIVLGLPVLFAIYHIAYGWGFSVGAVYLPLVSLRRTKPAQAFTALSR